jgi:PTS system beta-glucosides-specific IIC component
MANTNFFSRLFNRSSDKSESEVIENKNLSAASDVIVYSPIKGSVIPLSQVKDEVFSQEIMGKGVAIIPEEGKVFSPISGKVTTVFPTKHAIGLTGNNIEILIHIGMDTVELNGKYYKSHIKDGDKISVGDLLMEFDIEKIKAAGYEVVTPIIITNSNNFSSIKAVDAATVNAKDQLLTAAI